MMGDRMRAMPVSEIIFDVREDEVDGGFTASALGYGIHTQAETVQELRTVIRLHFVREEVISSEAAA